MSGQQVADRCSTSSQNTRQRKRPPSAKYCSPK